MIQTLVLSTLLFTGSGKSPQTFDFLQLDSKCPPCRGLVLERGILARKKLRQNQALEGKHRLRSHADPITLLIGLLLEEHVINQEGGTY